MAKDLPYFKFIISEWNDGDITLCSMEAQGLFINLCSLYWSLEGNLSITKAKRRYNGCNTTVWSELINEQIIKIDGDNIVINFLDEQFQERKKLSKTNSKNVSKRWKKAKENTTVIRPNNDRKDSVYNIEEKREEEKKEYTMDECLKNAFDSLYIDSQKTKWSHIDFDFEYETFCDKVRGSPDRYQEHNVSGLRLAFQAQLRTAKSTPKPPKVEVNKYETAEFNKGLWTLEAWEKEYNWALKRDPEFRKHFGYDEQLRISKTMGGNGKG